MVVRLGKRAAVLQNDTSNRVSVITEYTHIR